MLDLLKSWFPARTADLEAKLGAADGASGYGELEYEAWSNGNRRCEIELRALEGATAEVRVNGALVRALALADGRFDAKFSVKKGDTIPEMCAGDRVEVFQNGARVLDGVMEED